MDRVLIPHIDLSSAGCISHAGVRTYLSRQAPDAVVGYAWDPAASLVARVLAVKWPEAETVRDGGRFGTLLIAGRPQAVCYTEGVIALGETLDQAAESGDIGACYTAAEALAVLASVEGVR